MNILSCPQYNIETLCISIYAFKILELRVPQKQCLMMMLNIYKLVILIILRSWTCVTHIKKI